MTPRARAIARTMTGTAGIVSTLLVIALPATYFVVSYQYVNGALDTQAEVNAHATAQIVVANPTMWTFEQVRFAELLERRSSADVPEARRILDAKGQVVAESADALAWPVASRRHPVYDSGGAVGEFEVARSLRPLVLETGLALGAALLVAGLVFAALRIVPLRAVRLAYATLEESERRFRSLYETMGEGMALHRIACDGERRAISFSVVDANPAFARMLGVEAAGVAGMDGASLAGGALLPHLPQMQRAVETGERFSFELALPHPPRTLRLAVSSPQPGQFATLVEDVTQQKQAEALRLRERLSQAQKMEAVGCLAGGVAHDFNNILTVILSLGSALADELTGEQRENALEIERAGQRAAALTRQLLSFSRKQVLRPEVLRVDRALADISGMIGRLIGEHIQFSSRTTGDVGCIHMDPSQFEQVLVNLAVNARDAMPQGGRLTIEASGAVLPPAPEPDASGVAPGRYVVLRVSDTGTGMDEATRSRIFEPFFTTKPKGKGTGLGLAMVFGAIEQSGGHIEVASEPGAGTTFTIHLPHVESPQARREQAPSPVAPAGRGERILLVEDEPQLRAAIRLFLSGGGYRVVEAASGDEGLATFQADEQGIDLILTDLVMPGMGGLALGRAVRARRPVPVLYMTGYSEEIASGKESIPPGHLLQKPFGRTVLLDRVRAALADSDPARSPSVAVG
jgi:signal transduction histidine kinase/CheY-like chemotaxis protein